MKKIPHPEGMGYAPFTFDKYQEVADETAIYPRDTLLVALSYVTLGLTNEAGEVAGKLKKVMRDNNGVLTAEGHDALTSELGDVLWYAAQLATELEVSLAFVAEQNLLKLLARKENDTLRGSGDIR